jgi:peptidoglycan-associated lipoprotein
VTRFDWSKHKMTRLNFLRLMQVPLLAAALSMGLAACQSSSVELDKNSAGAPVESRTPGSRPGQSAVTPGTAGGAGGAGAAGQSGDTIPAGLARTIYFDFDSYVVREEYRPVIEQYAKALSANRKLKIAVEGHTDERGGREYNLALGQKRAEAITKALILLGAQDSQVESTSYGKERPAATGGGEDNWAKNRRAEMKDR